VNESDKDAGAGAGARFVEAVRRYAETQQEIADEAQRRPAEAAEEFARTVQEAQQQQPAGGGFGSAASFQEALSAYPSVARDAQQRWQEAVNAYQEALRAASEQLAQRQEEAFRAYIADLQAAWAEVDPKTIDAAEIAAIEQAMVAAACAPAQAAA
jgi:hypothetical protein